MQELSVEENNFLFKRLEKLVKEVLNLEEVVSNFGVLI